MSSETLGETQTPHVLVVAESSESAQAIVQRLGPEFEGGIRISSGPLSDITAAAAESEAAVVLFGLRSLAANERAARALRGSPGGEQVVVHLALCSAGEIAAANGLAREGVFDHYLPHPDAADPGRLATSVRLALRLARSGPPATLPRSRPIVLMVEDDEFTHQLVAVTLDSQDIELVFESDGAVALERIRAVRPDLVLMDVVLPGRDGVELTQGMKTDPELASIPVVMVTGEARREILMRSMEAGASDFIVKPFTPDALIAKLVKFLPTLR
jgi:CheY-like chemotaxis protein